MRICIYGAGAMGTSIGALLSKANIPCELVSRSQSHVASLNERGICVAGELDGTYPTKAIFPEQLSGKYDLIFLSAKQKENDEIAQYLKDFLKEDGALLSTQNGLPEPRLAEIIGADRVYGCALSWGAKRTQGGCVEITSESGFRFFLGAYGKGEKLSEIAALLSQIGIVTTGNLLELRYAKLAMNSAFSSLSALSGLSFGEISKKYKKYALRLIRETFAVAKAAGCKKLPLNGHNLFKVFQKPWGRALLPFAMKKYKNTYSGMLADLNAGRRCEIDFISGAVCAEGERLGVPTPTQARIVALIHDVENGLAELSPESIRLL